MFLRGQSHFSLFFFPSVKCFFPVENSHFGTSKRNFWRFQKWKAKKKKKKKKKKRFSPLFITFPTLISNFQSSLSQFSFFSSQFSPLFLFFSLPLFSRYVSKNFRSEVSGGHSAPCPHLLRHWMCHGHDLLFSHQPVLLSLSIYH